MGDGHLGGGERVLDEEVRALELLRVEPAPGLEVGDLAGDLRRDVGRVEARDATHARASRHDALPGGFGSRSERGDEPDPRHHDAAA
jgi:hypothetical protein